MDQILNNLKLAREQAGLTQKQVEEKLGLRRLQIRDYETGRLKLPVPVAMTLANLYGVSMDRLVGFGSAAAPSWQKCRALSNFNSIFSGHSFSMMFLDPVLRGFLEEKKELLIRESFFEVLTDSFSQKQKKSFVEELGQILFLLACADGKIDNAEVECIQSLLQEFDLSGKYNKFIKKNATAWLKENKLDIFSDVGIKHFVIWLCFLFSMADGEISHEEFIFIEQLAKKLKMNRKNFLVIQKQFVEEEL